MTEYLSVAVVLLGASLNSPAEPLLKNGSFEAAHPVTGAASSDAGFGIWTLGADRVAPDHWALNTAYPGELSVVSEGAPAGEKFLRVRATGEHRAAHIYQPCPGLRPGQWYRVTARVRGGTVRLHFYEYFREGPMGVRVMVTAAPGPDAWQQLHAYYTPDRPKIFASASLAIEVAEGETVDVDDVRVEEVQPPEDMAALEPVVLENDFVRMKLSPQARVEELVCKQTGVDYAARESSVPMFTLSRAGATIPAAYVRRKGDRLEVHFLDGETTATLDLETRPHYFTLAVEEVAGPDADWLQLCDLRLEITENVGTLINAAWNDRFGACVLACNDRTHSYGASGSRAMLSAKCYAQYGMKGAKIAICAVPTGRPDPAAKLLDVIERVELEQGLPHPTINGVWIKRAPERLDSYMMSHGVGEKNVDQVIELAKGGFGCIEIYPWHSMPTYGVNPGLFPSGLAGLKQCADKIHAAGLQLGLHAMQGMVGWGGMHDPYVRPKGDPRLLQDRHATLAAAVDAKATELVVKENLAEWPETGDLYLDGEIVRYARRTENALAECQRALHGTEVAAHPQGTPVGHLVNCFKMWGHCIYAPDVNSTMIDEICDNIARVFNETGADMSYFDGGEEVAVQPPHWHNQGKIALGVMRRLDKPVILEGNALYTHLSWHVITRGSPSFDPIYWGRREYTLRAKGQNPANWAKNLLTGDVGWFAPHVHSLSTDAVTPDEVMLLCLKALGGKAPISFHVDANNPFANKRMPEMLEIIRICDELKRREYFSEEVCAELTKPMAEHVLEPAPGGEWIVRPLRFGPPRTLHAGRPDGHEWNYPNPFAEQTPWLRLRARARLAPYGAEDNIVLADFEQDVPFEPDGSASAQLVHSVEVSTEKTPDGSATFRYRAHNQSDAPSGWSRISLPFDPPLDLSNHRRIGIWVHADGQGGILNVQLANTYGYRDHYIPLDFKGWSYRELDPPEDTRFYDYRWPYNFVDLMYWRFRYHEVTGLNVYYNALPAKADVSCLIGRVEALRENPQPLQSPALEVAGKRIVFPVSLKPDEYVELDGTGRCRHFEPNGGLVAEVQPEGSIRLAPGDNAVRFTCEANDSTTSRAEVILAVKGEPLENRKQLPDERERRAAFSGSRIYTLSGEQTMKPMTRRSLIRAVAAIPAAAALFDPAEGDADSEDPKPRRFSDAGWCWDGQGFNGGVNPSIFGAGEGTRWFGLGKTAFMFHPNTELALEKLRDFEEVICEISKWKVRRCENGVAHYLDGAIETKRQEAAAVGRLSRSFANVTGAIDDDLLGIIRREKIKPDQYRLVYEALKAGNPELKLWVVVYDNELDRDNWAGFEPLVDVVNLCVGHQTQDFPRLGRFLDQCEELFLGKPVNLIYRLRDFRKRPVGPVSMDLLAEHWKDIRKYVDQGRLSGYSILGGFLIDMHPEQARWVRDFIAAG